MNGSTTSRGDSYTESVAQPNPSPAQLRGQRHYAGGAGDPTLLDVPGQPAQAGTHHDAER